MQTQEWLRDASVGQRVSLCGFVFVTGDATFVAPDEASFDRGERIEVADAGRIAAHLFNTLPPYGGGTCAYVEECTICGILDGGPGEYRLRDIESCAITATIDVPMD